MIKKTIVLSSLFLLLQAFLTAQDTLNSADSLTDASAKAIEQAPIKKKFRLKNYFKEGYPSPKKAVTLAVLPGLGQIYNKDYWKLPIVYAALGGVIYSIDYNTRQYEIFRKIYDAKINPDSEHEDLLPTLPNAAVKAARDGFDKNRQLSWVGVFGFYLLSAGEAFVDAHLKDFNVNDDISFQPSIQSTASQAPTIGLSLKIKLSK